MLTATVTWIDPIYEAALDDAPEWPPHPARLFCALVAASRSDVDHQVLNWLEEQGAPRIFAPAAQAGPGLTSFVPTNQVVETKSNRVARTNGERRWHRSHMAEARVRFVWPVSPPEGVLGRLDGLARRVPYLGRASSQCCVGFSDEPDAKRAAADLVEYEPSGRSGGARLRVPYPGYLAALRDAYELDQPSRDADRWLFYRRVPKPDDQEGVRPDPGAETSVAVGPYPHLLLLGFRPGIQLDGRLVLRVTTAFKAAVLSRLGQSHTPEELALLHGHHDGSGRQCAFLALPVVGRSEHRGDIAGVGLAVSDDLPRQVRRSVLHLFALGRKEARLRELMVPDIATVTLSEADGRWVLNPERWIKPCHRWVSVLPMVLDRYPDNQQEKVDFIHRGVVMAGYPEPADVEIMSGPGQRGAAQLRRSDLRRAQDPPRPTAHVRVTFEQPVQGPVVLGRLRHLGLGLCVPESIKKEDR